MGCLSVDFVVVLYAMALGDLGEDLTDASSVPLSSGAVGGQPNQLPSSATVAPDTASSVPMGGARRKDTNVLRLGADLDRSLSGNRQTFREAVEMPTPMMIQRIRKSEKDRERLIKINEEMRRMLEQCGLDVPCFCEEHDEFVPEVTQPSAPPASPMSSLQESFRGLRLSTTSNPARRVGTSSHINDASRVTTSATASAISFSVPQMSVPQRSTINPHPHSQPIDPRVRDDITSARKRHGEVDQGSRAFGLRNDANSSDGLLGPRVRDDDLQGSWAQPITGGNVYRDRASGAEQPRGNALRDHHREWTQQPRPRSSMVSQDDWLERDFLINTKISNVIKGWNHRFSGGSDKMNVLDYLERLRAMALADGVTTRDLHRCAMHLFKEEALSWYFAYGRSCPDWGQLMSDLTATYLRPDYFHTLEAKIRTRRQRQGETFVQFLSELELMYAKLTRHVNEEEKIMNAQYNALPVYRRFMVNARIRSIDELLEICLNVEQWLESDRSTNRGDRGQEIHELETEENEEICAMTRKRNFKRSVATQVSSPEEDYKLRKEEPEKGMRRLSDEPGKSDRGDTSSNEKKYVHCYKCGLPDYTSLNCPHCSSKNWRRRDV